MPLVVVVMGWSQPLAAATVSIESVVGANLGCNPTAVPDECLNFEDPVNIQEFGLAGALISRNYTDGSLTQSLARAQAAFGQLKVEASATFNLSTSDTRFVFANAQVIDTLTIDGSGDGTLDMTFSYGGTLSASGSAASGSFVLFEWDTPLESGDDFQFTEAPGTVSQTFTRTIPIRYGEAFVVGYALGVGAGTRVFPCSSPSGFCFEEASGSGVASADFFNTLDLTGLIPKDSNGVPIVNPLFSSASGAVYTVNGVTPVPEPVSMILVGSGLGMAALRRRHASRIGNRGR